MIYKFNDFLNENTNSVDKYNSIIDYTYLKKNTSIDKIKEVCEIAKENNFHSVCVYPEYVSDVYGFLEDNNIKISTVINYPDGKNKSEQNIKDVLTVISEGVDEIDFVMDYKILKETTILEDILKSKISRNELTKDEIKENQDDIKDKYEKIENSILDISNICTKNGILLKIIIESGELSYEQIRKACEICSRVGVDYVMTSTGTKNIGAELEKVKQIRKHLPEFIKIKVSGGIRTIQDAEKFYPYVDRIGTSVILKDIK